MNGATVRLEWGPPPTKGPGETTTALLGLLPELDARPGEWAQLATFDTSHGAHNSKRNLTKRRPWVLERYELAARKRDGTSALWGRRKEAA